MNGNPCIYTYIINGSQEIPANPRRRDLGGRDLDISLWLAVDARCCRRVGGIHDVGRSDLSDGADLMAVWNGRWGVVPFEFKGIAGHWGPDDTDDGSLGRIGR